MTRKFFVTILGLFLLVVSVTTVDVNAIKYENTEGTVSHTISSAIHSGIVLDATYGSNIGRLHGDNATVTCGDIKEIPSALVTVTKTIYLVLQAVVPIILIILGLLDLAKGIASQKEDEIKRGQQTFLKRLLTAAIVFFIFTAVSMVTTMLKDSNTITDCLNCFIKGTCVTTGDETVEEEPSSGEPVGMLF